MLAFLLELHNYWVGGAFYPFAAFMLLVWIIWFVRLALLRRYHPWRRSWHGGTAVLIPVVNEPAELFREVLARITEQGPTEVLVVINGPRNEVLEELCDEAGVRRLWTATPGKRNALRIGLENTSSEITVLVDSDTLWTEGTLAELVKPFRHPQVGGVTTRQRILDPGRSVLTRWADWLESVRCEYSLPAMSVLGTVGCLPGRTIAFRRQILLDCLDRFLTERFLGTLLEVSDDRTLTNYTLKAGYKAVYQSTSLVYTDAPTQLRKLVKQQYRWARGSQYNTLRMMPWMIREARFLAVFYAIDILVPFVLLGTFTSWVSAFALHRLRPEVYGQLPLPLDPARSIPLVIGLAALMSLVSVSVRFGRHFAYRPSDMLFLPVFMVINTFILLPVRLIGFFRCAHDASWGTRADGFSGRRARNPWVVLPYLLGGLMLTVSVLISA